MEPLNKIWLDGRLVNWDEANIHILTHGLHYGSSVFEGIRCYKTSEGRAIFRLDEHIDRFFYSASCLGIKFKFSKEDLNKATVSLVKANKADECYIRPIAFCGYGKMGLSPAGAPISIAISSWLWNVQQLGRKGVSTKISKFSRLHPSSVVIDAKVGGYYSNSILASNDATDNGFNEAILLDHEGNIAEGPGENIFIVKRGVIYTPSRGNILPGITRDSVIKIARDLKIKVIEKKIDPEELNKVDEAFFTGTAVEIWPILSVDGKKIGNGKVGPISKKLVNEYERIVGGEDIKYSKWLYPVKDKANEYNYKR